MTRKMIYSVIARCLRYCLVEPIPADIVITTNGGYPLAAADELLGRSDGRITAIPDGISVVVTK